MPNIYRSLLLVIAGATQKELARQIKYLKVENEILRSRLPQRLVVTPRERHRLVKFASRLTKRVLQQLVSIVHPDTMLRWKREGRRAKGKQTKVVKRGRKRTERQMVLLILKMARENDWGYTRIMGELKKLGITPPSRNTVKRILKSAGLDPGPKRGEGTWDEFLIQHAASLWQCDFFCRRVLTWKGFRQAFVLVFIHVETRRVILSNATYKPSAAWVEANGECFVDLARSQGLPITILMRDNDYLFRPTFDEFLADKDVEVLKTQFRAPNMNAYAERFVQTIQQECTDHFVVFGTQHLDYLCGELVEHYHMERPHQGLENELPVRPPSRNNRRSAVAKDKLPSVADIRCHSRLGGLLKSYSRKAA